MTSKIFFFLYYSFAQAEHVTGGGFSDERFQDIGLPTDHRLLSIREEIHIRSGMRQYVLQGTGLQGALSLSGLQRPSIREEGGNDQALQVAQEEGRVPAARLHEILADRRLLGEASRPGLPAQQKANPLSLHPRELRQGIHIDVGRADARELSSQGLGHHTRGLPAISGN